MTRNAIKDRPIDPEMANSTSKADAGELSATLCKIAEQSHRIAIRFMARQVKQGDLEADPLKIGDAFLKMTQRMLRTKTNTAKRRG